MAPGFEVVYSVFHKYWANPGSIVPGVCRARSLLGDRDQSCLYQHVGHYYYRR